MCRVTGEVYLLPEILNKMAAALAHIVHPNDIRNCKISKYNNQELMVPSATDRDILSTDSAIH